MPYSFETLRFRIADHREVGREILRLLNVLRPLAVVVDRVDAQAMILGKRSAMLPRAGNDEPRSTRELE